MAITKPPPKKKPAGEAGATSSNTAPAGSQPAAGNVPAAAPQKAPQTPVSAPAGQGAAAPQKSAQGVGSSPVKPKKPADVMRVGAGKVSLSQGRIPKSTKPGSETSEGAKDQAADRKVQTERVEERVFAVLGTKELQEPKLLKDFVEKLGPCLMIPPTSEAILEAFSNIDVTAEKLGQCIRSNSYYEFQFLKAIESMGKRQELPSIEAAIILLGMQNSRDLILALQMLRTVHATHPERGKDGKLAFAPKDVLKYALKTEELLAGNKDGYSDTAYAAGLLFDYVAQICGALAQDPKAAAAYLDGIYNHGLRTARVGAELAKLIPDFGHKKYAFAACLVHDIGKAVMAVLEPGYLDFVEEGAKANLNRRTREFAETKRFGIDHGTISALCCNYFPIFKGIERALQYHHAPYLLRASNKHQYQLAGLIALSTNIANNFRKADQPTDAIVRTWLGPELEGFRLGAKEAMSALARAMQAGTV